MIVAVAATVIITFGINITVNGIRYYQKDASAESAALRKFALIQQLRENQKVFANWVLSDGKIKDEIVRDVKQHFNSFMTNPPANWRGGCCGTISSKPGRRCAASGCWASATPCPICGFI
jgi:hypothetical protein